MELFQLEQFLAIAECGTLRNASEKCFVTAPALSQNLKTLESELGVQLFDRRNRRLVINQNGMIFRKYAEEICQNVTECRYEMNRLSEHTAERINVGSTDGGFLTYILPLYMMTPNSRPVKSVIYPDNTSLKQALLRGEIDIAAPTLHLPDDFTAETAEKSANRGAPWQDRSDSLAFFDPRYEIVNLQLLRIYMYVSIPDWHPLYEKKDVVLEDLNGESVLWTNTPACRHLEKHLGHLGIRINYAETVDRAEYNILQRSGKYLFFVNSYPMFHYRNNPGRRLVRVDIDWPGQESFAYVSCLKFNQNGMLLHDWFAKSYTETFRGAQKDLIVL